jgi:Tfp pilus assembly protein PilE
VGFSLLKMMMVVTVILIAASIATPIYQTCATRAREAVLRDHLFQALSSQPSAFSGHAEKGGPRYALAKGRLTRSAG